MAAKRFPPLLSMMICMPLFFLRLVDAAWVEARSNDAAAAAALLSSPHLHGQLMKRDLSTPSNSCLPALDATSCDGLTGCATYCCSADQECCNALGCRPKDSNRCVTGYATDGWACCGTSWQYPASQGAICCGGSQGWWCPAGFQCVKHDIVEYRCCTDDDCNVYWNGTDSVTVSASTTTTTTKMSTTSPPAPTKPTTTSTTKKSTSVKSSSSTRTSSIAPAKPTTCNPSGSPQPTFILQQTSSSLAAENGTYAVLSNSAGNGNDTVSFGSTAAKATKFTFNKACGLVGVNSKEVANIHHTPMNNTSAATTLYFDSPANVTKMDYNGAACNVTSNKLTCQVEEEQGVKWFSCAGKLALGGKAGKGCVKITLTPHFW